MVDGALGKVIGFLRGQESQAVVAGRAGISRSSWSAYERGRIYPGAANRDKIAVALNCDLVGLNELEARVRSGRLVLELGVWSESPRDMLLLVRVLELQQISDPGTRAVWRELSVAFDRCRYVLWMLITR